MVKLNNFAIISAFICGLLALLALFIDFSFINKIFNLLSAQKVFHGETIGNEVSQSYIWLLLATLIGFVITSNRKRL